MFFLKKMFKKKQALKKKISSCVVRNYSEDIGIYSNGEILVEGQDFTVEKLEGQYSKIHFIYGAEYLEVKRVTIYYCPKSIRPKKIVDSRAWGFKKVCYGDYPSP